MLSKAPKLGHWIAVQIARLLLTHMRAVVIVAAVVAVTAAAIASGLRLDTSFAALLPEQTPEVVELKSLRERIGGTVELIIAVGGDKHARLDFAKKVVAHLRGKAWIRRADVEFPVDFFLDRQLLLLPIKDLKALQRSLDQEIEHVKARANPLFVDLEDEDERGPKPWEDVDRRSKLSESAGLLKRHFTSADGKYLFVRVLPKGSVSDMDAGAKLLAEIKAVVQAEKPDAAGVSVRYAGGLPLNQEQNHRMRTDLRRASLVALALVLLLLTSYIRRLASPVVLAVPLICGLLVTFAITRLTIGQLNLVSGFLVTALIGLGIDFEIHLYLRYLEKLPHADSPRTAMGEAIEGTFPGCLTAALTTAAAFFAMTISDFRGFSEYGAIAGLGVLVTLVMTYVTLPPLALLMNRRGKVRSLRVFRPRQLSRTLARAMVAVAVLFSVVSAYWASKVRYHNDFQKLRGHSATVDFSDQVDKAFGGSLAPAAILVDNVKQAREVERRLRERKRDPHSGVKRFLSLASMVPDATEDRGPVLAKMKASLKSVPLDKLDKEDREHVAKALKQVDMPPWQVKDIPEAYRQQFMTADQRGTLVLVWPRYGMHEDAEVIAWGDELSSLQTELRRAGIGATILDENRIAARVLEQMRHDAPRVLAYAALAVLLLLIIDFRNTRQVLIVGGSLAVGILWFLGLVHLFGFEINVFNQAVIPSLLGLGLDNAVHLQHRYTLEGPGSLPLVVATTGSASFLASATTGIGFGAAVTAYHYGVQSMGWLAIIGFSCTFLSTTVFFPAMLRALEPKFLS